MEEVTSADSPLFRDLMRFKPDGWTANAWAVNAGVSRTVWTDMRRHGNPSRKTLEKLLAAAGSSLAEFEALRIGDATVPLQGTSLLANPAAQPWRLAPTPPLPLVASRAGEPLDTGSQRIPSTELNAADIVGSLPRPASLATDRDAYAFTVTGDVMWPRFRQGRRVAVSPNAKVAEGDDVAATIRKDPGTGMALVVLGELVDPGTVLLRQFNPDIVYRLNPRRIIAMHKVVGELI